MARNVFQEVNPEPSEPASGGGLIEAARNNPVLTGALALGLGAVTGPQMMKMLQRTMMNPKATAGQMERFSKMLAPFQDEATEAWKMVGGSGPTKLDYLGGGVDAAAFGVRPGNVVLKLARPGGTHMGFDPHQIADTAPRNVMLPVLEHGQFQDPTGRGLSWFVQPKAKPLTTLEDKWKTFKRLGQETPRSYKVYEELLAELQRSKEPWTIIDQHSGNAGRWAGRNWIIDLGSMKRIGSAGARRTETPLPSMKTQPSGPQGLTPASPPPGWGTPPRSIEPGSPPTSKARYGRGTASFARDVLEKGKGKRLTGDLPHEPPIDTWLMNRAEHIMQNVNKWGRRP